MQLHPEPFRQHPYRRLGGTIDHSAGRKHLDPDNRSDVDDVTALLLLHLRQDGGNAVEDSLDIDVNLPIPFLHLEGLNRRNGHDTGVIDDDLDAAEAVDGSLDQCFHFGALRDVDRKADSLTVRRHNLLHDRVDPVLTPRSEHDFGSASRKQLRSALSNATAGSGDYYDFVCSM